MIYTKRKISLIGLAIAVVVAIGLLVPLGSYTTTSGCPSDSNPTVRLHLIFGQSLDEIKKSDKPAIDPLMGCSQNATYVLYLL